MTLPASRRGWRGIDRRGYLGARESVRVFGWWKVVLLRTLVTLCELTCFVKNKPSDDGSSDTPQVHGMEMLTPRRVAFAAAEAFADGLLPSVKILSVFSSLRPWKSSHLRLCGAVCRKRAQSLLKSTYCPLLLPLVPLYRLVSLGGYASCNWRQQKRGLVLGVILGRISDLLAGTVRSDARSPLSLLRPTFTCTTNNLKTKGNTSHT